MSDEMETGAAASLGGLKSGGRGETAPPGLPCRNCNAVVNRRYCGQCGQLASNFHRPVWNLIAETVSDSLALDGRIARSLPALLFRPGRMTRDYLDGKRARFVPPFRLFLLCSLIFFTLFFFIAERQGWTEGVVLVREPDGSVSLQLGDAETAGEGELLSDYRSENGRLDRDALMQAIEGANDQAATPPADEQEEPPATTSHIEARISIEDENADARALIDRAARIYENQALFFAGLREMAPRMALVLPLVFILILTLLYAWRRSVYVYDHMISALHLQSAIYLAISLAMIIAIWLGAMPILIVLAILPVYLWLHLRAAYGDGLIMASLRTIVVLLVSLVSLTLIVAGTIVLGAMSV